MFRDADADANVVRALAFEPQLRSWLALCVLDEAQIEDALNHVYEQVLVNVTRPLRGEQMRRRTFEFAQQFAHSLGRQAPNGKTPECELPRVPMPVPAGEMESARAAEDERFGLAIRAISPRCYSVFYSNKIERLSHRQVAERLSMTLVEVERELTRAALVCAEVLRNPASVPDGRPDTERVSSADHLPAPGALR